MKRKKVLKHLLLSLCSALAVPLAVIAPSLWSTQSHAQVAQAVGKAKAAEIAKEKYGGKVLNVKESVSNGKTVYRVKLLLDGGRVKIVTINGSSNAS